MKSEQVLNLELLPVQETEVKGETTEQRCQWMVQRIRLSPQEKHLAATVKSHHCTELRYLHVAKHSARESNTGNLYFTEICF